MNTIPESFNEYRESLTETLQLEPHGEDDNGNPVYKQKGGKRLFIKVDGRMHTCVDDVHFEADRPVTDKYEIVESIAVDEASGKPITREIIRRGMDGNFKDYEYGFLEEDPSTLAVSHTGTDRKPTKKDLEEAAAEVAEYFASKGHKVACVKDTVVFHDLADGIDETSAFWGKEQIKWFTVLDNKVGNLATVLLWLRGWYPTEERFKADRARIEQAIEGMKGSSDEISEMVDEIGDYLKSTLAGMNTYKARI